MNRRVSVLVFLVCCTTVVSADPGWWRALEDRLAKTKVSVDFRESPTHQVARLLGRFAGVDVTLDPPLGDQAVTLRAEDECAADVLDRLAEALGARWDLRWGGVFIAAEERLTLLPEDLPGALAALDAPVSLDFAGVPLPAALEMLASQSGVEFEVSPPARERVEAALVYVDARQASIRDVLCRMLYPAGLALEIDGERVRIAPAMTKRAATWQEELEHTLGTTRVDVDFLDRDLADALAFLSRAAGVAIDLDPGVLRERSREELLITLRVDGVSVQNAMALITLTWSLEQDLRWGGLFVSTAERLKELPAPALPDRPAREQPEWERELRARLQARVTAAFEKTPVEQVLVSLATRSGVRLRLDPEAAEAGVRSTVTIRIDDATLEHALGRALLPMGFRLRLEPEGVSVTRAR